MSKVLSVRMDDEFADWADGYAQERGVSRQVLLENALVSFREDCESGVPELRERVKDLRRRSEPGPGECSCPDVPAVDGNGTVKGFSTKCPVHGGRTRADFAEYCRERSALFATLRVPDSVRGGVKKKEPK